MDDALPVRVVERVGDLDAEAQRLVERQRPLREPLGERLAFEQLHDQVVGVALVADVVERADVRVRELRDRLRLALEALADFGGFREVLGQHLDRDRAVEARVARAIDLAHATRAERRKDLVGAEAGAGCEGHGVGKIVWRGLGARPSSSPSPGDGEGRGEGLPIREKVLFQCANSPIQLTGGEPDHRADFRHLASDGAKLPRRLLAKALEPSATMRISVRSPSATTLKWRLICSTASVSIDAYLSRAYHRHRVFFPSPGDGRGSG